MILSLMNINRFFYGGGFFVIFFLVFFLILGGLHLHPHPEYPWLAQE